MAILKLTDNEIKNEIKKENSISKKLDKIPYNLSFSLHERELEKLSVSALDFEVGEEFTADVVVRVMSVSQNENEERGKDSHVSLGISSMSMNMKKSNKELANTLFDNK